MSLKENRPPKNILFIPSGSIGDAVMMLVLCAEIDKYTPGTKFTIIARRNAKLIADLAAHYPAITVTAIEKNVRGLWVLAWQAFSKPYIAFMPATFGKSWFLNTEQLFRLLSIRPGTKTYGLLKKQGDINPYSYGLVYDQGLLHIDNMRRLALAAGMQVEPEGSSIAFNFNSYVPKHFPFLPKSYLVLHPFGSSSWKSWPPRRCRELLLELSTLFPELSFVVTGGKENTKQAKEIVDGIPRTTTLLDAHILEVIGIIDASAVFIGVDTGTMHLASVIQHKVIALEHNASPEWLPSYNPNARILSNLEHCACTGTKNNQCKVMVDGLPYMRCLYDISDASILDAVNEVLTVTSSATL